MYKFFFWTNFFSSPNQYNLALIARLRLEQKIHYYFCNTYINFSVNKIQPIAILESH